MAERKLNELAADLDDLTVTVDELKDAAGESDMNRLKEVEQALDTARDTVDDIADDGDE